MAHYIMLTRLSHEALKSPSSLAELSHAVTERIKAECPGVHWQASYVVLGPCDYVDLFEASDNEVATKVATIIRTFGHATTEIWPAVEWHKFKELVRYLPPAAACAAHIARHGLTARLKNRLILRALSPHPSRRAKKGALRMRGQGVSKDQWRFFKRT